MFTYAIHYSPYKRHQRFSKRKFCLANTAILQLRHVYIDSMNVDYYDKAYATIHTILQYQVADITIIHHIMSHYNPYKIDSLAALHLT